MVRLNTKQKAQTPFSDESIPDLTDDLLGERKLNENDRYPFHLPIS
jgi:hypothetical protein